MTGIVRRFNADRGFGFIAPLVGKPNDVESIFFHISAVTCDGERVRSVPVGCEVAFDLVRGEKGPQAANVRIRTLSGKALQ